MRVFLCEKPSQAKDVAKALGCSQRKNGYFTNGKDSVVWAIGHLLSQAQPEFYQPELARKKQGWQVALLPVVPEKWTMQLPDRNKDGGRYAQAQAIESLLKQAKEVVIATDNDREGSTIAIELMEYYKYKGTSKRMIYSSMDDKSVKASLSNLQDSKRAYLEYIAGLGRMRADWLFGLNMTMALTSSNKRMIAMGDVLSAGRVQSPIVYLLVLRETERKNFVPVEFFKFDGDFKKKDTGEKYSGSLKIRQEFIDEKTGYLIDAEKMKALQKELGTSKGAEVVKYEKKAKKEKAPIGFSLSELQKEGSKRFGFPAKKTLDTAQALYEKHKLTTYPRSDSGYMDDNQFPDAPAVLSTIKNNFSNKDYDTCLQSTNPKHKSQMWNRSKVTAHHAIIPTITKKSVNQLSKDEMALYDLICKRYLMQFMPDYEFMNVSFETKVVNDIFTTSGNTTTNMGWKAADPKLKQSNKMLPILSKGEKVDVVKIKDKKDQTKPPPSYTEEQLLDDLVNIRRFIENPQLKKIIKETGIGTEATRAGHLDNIERKGYFKRDGKKIMPTDKAYAIMEVLPENLKLPETTAYWEEELNQIVEGKRTLDQFMGKVKNVLTRMVGEVKAGNCQLKKPVSGGASGKIYTCDKCSGMVSRIKTKKTKKHLWVCSECSIFYEDKVGRRGALIVRAEQPKGDFPCPKCKKNKMMRRKKKAVEEFFWVCSDDKCKTFCKDNNGQLGEMNIPKVKQTSDHKCPNCKDGSLIQRKSAKGAFWGCNNFPKCKTTAMDEDNKPKIIPPKK
jgi:DNA topoisomerase-3